MQKIFIYLSLLIFGISPLLSDETQKQPTEINKLVSKIKDATPSDKRVLINELKVKLRDLNRESRQKIMMDLRKSFNKKGLSMQTQKRGSNQSDNITPQKRRMEQSKNRPMKNRPMKNGQQKGR